MFAARRLVIVSVWMLSAGLMLAGCASEDEPRIAEDLCDDVIKAECGKFFQCTTPSTRGMLGLQGTLAECIIWAAGAVQCQGATWEKVCGGPSPTFSVMQAETCIKEVKAASCLQIIANTTNVAAYAPSCGQCIPPLGSLM